MRRIVSITGTRADYGLMEPVHRAIAAERGMRLDLIVTGMHLLPDFSVALAQVRADAIGTLHEVAMAADGDSGSAMAQCVATGVLGIAPLLERLRPSIVLVQGDRGEMLAAAIASAHMNIPLVHMSGGDFSGSIDDSVRNAISKFAHFHLTSTGASTARLVGLGESPDRIVEVGDPALDQLRTLQPVPLEALAAELDLPRDEPFLIATLHPVTDEADQAATQMTTLLEALAEAGLNVVFTYPNTDAGGRAMRDVLDSWRGRAFLRIAPTLGSRRYLSLLRHAAAVVGNSSSGIVESPSFHLPAVNVGSRQHGRLRAGNVLDVAFDRSAIAAAIRFALYDAAWRSQLAECRNPYGDGHAAERSLDVLRRLRLDANLIAKWRSPHGKFLDA